MVYNRNPNGNSYVRYLYWSGDRWDWCASWLSGDWVGSNPALVSRNSLHFSLAMAGEFCFSTCPNHPPSIRPISSNLVEIVIYFFVSIYFVSQSIRSNSFFDQYIKQTLKVKHDIRYADDFVFLHHDRNHLSLMVQSIELYVQHNLRLELHPNKVSIATVASGVDFLGWVQFPYHQTLRGVTRRRVMKMLLDPEVSETTRQSYVGLLRKGNNYGLLRSALAKTMEGNIPFSK